MTSSNSSGSSGEPPICSYWVNSKCHFGARCKNAHPVLLPSDPPPSLDQRPPRPCSPPLPAAPEIEAGECPTCTQMLVTNKMLTYERSDLLEQATALQAENASLQKSLVQARSSTSAWERRFDSCLSEKAALEKETLSLLAKVEHSQ
jgi:hypothetical protein